MRDCPFCGTNDCCFFMTHNHLWECDNCGRGHTHNEGAQIRHNPVAIPLKHPVEYEHELASLKEQNKRLQNLVSELEEEIRVIHKGESK